jgi:hypothetical protein
VVAEGLILPNGVVFTGATGPIVGELDKGESGLFPGLSMSCASSMQGLPLGWRARCTILELEWSNGQRTNRAEEL